MKKWIAVLIAAVAFLLLAVSESQAGWRSRGGCSSCAGGSCSHDISSASMDPLPQARAPKGGCDIAAEDGTVKHYAGGEFLPKGYVCKNDKCVKIKDNSGPPHASKTVTKTVTVEKEGTRGRFFRARVFGGCRGGCCGG